MKDANLFFFHSPFMGNRTKRATVCGIYNPTTGEMNFGVSVCSELDNFSRRDGRTRAIARAQVPMITFRKDTIEDLRKFANAKDGENHKAFLAIAPGLAMSAIIGKPAYGVDRNFKKYDKATPTAAPESPAVTA